MHKCIPAFKICSGVDELNSPDEYVLALQIAVGDGRLPVGAHDLHVEVRHAGGDPEKHPDRLGHGDRVVGEVVGEGAVPHVLGDEPQLRPRPAVLVVGRDEAEDVLVPQHHRLVDLHLPEPRLLVDGREYLDGDPLPAPVAEPYFAEATLTDDFLK